MGWLDSFEGDARTGPRCSSVDPVSGKRCALDRGHWKTHKCAIVKAGKKPNDRDADIREWR